MPSHARQPHVKTPHPPEIPQQKTKYQLSSSTRHLTNQTYLTMIEQKHAIKILQLQISHNKSSCSLTIKTLSSWTITRKKSINGTKNTKKMADKKHMARVIVPHHLILIDNIIPWLKKLNVKSISIKFLIPNIVLNEPFFVNDASDVVIQCDKAQHVISCSISSIMNSLLSLEELHINIEEPPHDFRTHDGFLDKKNEFLHNQYNGWELHRKYDDNEDINFYKEISLGRCVSKHLKVLTFDALSVVGLYFYFDEFHLPNIDHILTTTTVPCIEQGHCQLAPWSPGDDDELPSAQREIYPNCQTPSNNARMGNSNHSIQGFRYSDSDDCDYTLEYHMFQKDNEVGKCSLHVSHLADKIALDSVGIKKEITIFCDSSQLHFEKVQVSVHAIPLHR